MSLSRRGFFVMVFLVALAGGMIAVGGYSLIFDSQRDQPSYNSIQERQQIALVNNNLPDPAKKNYTVPDGLNFIEAAAISTPTVVHIRSKFDAETSYNGLFRYRSYPSSSQGSGVIISDDGYIVTNNHVVEGANTFEVTLWDNRVYDAEIIGTDPTTDLALVKIDEQDLNFLPYGDSDDLAIGEWVLAVGNPFNLTSTVTAGIVSAKARNIRILSEENNLQIESFIQTDAAVNPGNSGGALVDLNGTLVGINTAIASQTGSYAGYSFAVPVTLVKKVMDDLLEFGVVQRALLGIQIGDASDVSRREEFNLDLVNGVYVLVVNDNSAAKEAGIKEGDVIIAIDGKQTNNTSELQELVARNRPGDKISVTFIRNGKEQTTSAILRNFEGDIRVVEKPKEKDIELEGALFENITRAEAAQLGIDGGVRITEVESGVWEKAGIEEGFIITEIDKNPVQDLDDLKRILANKQNERIIVLGLDSQGDRSYYSMDW
jgi:Do/DeqQ family serine protease